MDINKGLKIEHMAETVHVSVLPRHTVRSLLADGHFKSWLQHKCTILQFDKVSSGVLNVARKILKIYPIFVSRVAKVVKDYSKNLANWILVIQFVLMFTQKQAENRLSWASLEDVICILHNIGFFMVS